MLLSCWILLLVWVHECTNTFKTRKQIYMHASILYTHAKMYMHTKTHACMHTRTYIHVCIRTSEENKHTYVYAYVCMCTRADERRQHTWSTDSYVYESDLGSFDQCVQLITLYSWNCRIADSWIHTSQRDEGHQWLKIQLWTGNFGPLPYFGSSKKFCFEVLKNETPRLFAVSVEYLLFPLISRLVMVFSAAAEIGRFQIYSSTAVLTRQRWYASHKRWHVSATPSRWSDVVNPHCTTLYFL